MSLFNFLLAIVFTLMIFSGLDFFFSIFFKKTEVADLKESNRETPIGEIDDKGWRQEKQKVDKIEKSKDELPEGLGSSDVFSEVKTELEIDGKIIHKNDSKMFAKDMRSKYLIVYIFLSFISLAETIEVDKKDLINMIEKIERLGEIEEAKPMLQISPIEFLYDSDGRIYTKPKLTGILNIHDLSYKLNADLNVTVIRKQKKSLEKHFSLSVFYSNLNWTFLNKENKTEFGIAGTIEFLKVRPLIYGTVKTYGMGLRLPIYGNSGCLVGIDCPSLLPRIGILFKL